MQNKLKLRVSLLLAMTAVLAACGGSGGGSDGGSAPDGGGGKVPAPPPPVVGDPGPSDPPAPPPSGTPAPPIDLGKVAPIMFVTQVPVTGSDMSKITGTFGNHLPKTEAAPRGGDLMIAYPPTTPTGAWALRNLTQEAGYGMKNNMPDTAQCAGNMVAVREPAVNWSATEALVSMVVGCNDSARWQIYRVANIGQGQGKATFTRVGKQPADYNNVSPIYSAHASEHIFFTSDMPRGGPGAEFAHLKALDEYELAPANSGLWDLDPVSGRLTLMDHSPSGDFNPTIDSFGRVVFGKWDHLDRDQQEDDQYHREHLFNYASESKTAQRVKFTAADNLFDSVFPESRTPPPGFGTHVMKVFMPWMVNHDGTGAETLNHFGRHQFNQYSDETRFDSRLQLEKLESAEGANQSIPIRPEGLRFLREDPMNPGLFYGAVTREFGTNGAGAVITLNAAPSVQPKDMKISFVTAPNTYDAGGPALYRSPLPTGDGSLWATMSTETKQTVNGNTKPYNFRLHRLVKSGSHFVPAQGGALTPGLQRTLGGKTYDLWEFDAVEVRARNKPQTLTAMEPITPQSPEGQVFADPAVNVDIANFRKYLKDQNLALIVTRNVTTRAAEDRMQPFNLRVRGSDVVTKSISKPNALVMDVDHLQLFSAQQVRGQDFVSDTRPNTDMYRRAMALPWKSPEINGKSLNPPAAASAPVGSVRVSTVDGSVAALVPANRAMTWQLIDSHNPGSPKDGTDSVVRERVWVAFQPGEVRVCSSCHGGSPDDLAQNGKKLKEVVNPPDALKQLLVYWKNNLQEP
jgi:hypothetical protein